MAAFLVLFYLSLFYFFWCQIIYIFVFIFMLVSQTRKTQRAFTSSDQSRPTFVGHFVIYWLLFSVVVFFASSHSMFALYFLSCCIAFLLYWLTNLLSLLLSLLSRKKFYSIFYYEQYAINKYTQRENLYFLVSFKRIKLLLCWLSSLKWSITK